MAQNIYKLSDGLTPVSWQLPLKGLTLKKFEKVLNKDTGKEEEVFVGKRRVKYVEGTNSIFEEDLKGDYVARSIWFEHGELYVDKDDTLLNYILQNHPWYDKKFYLWSEENELKQELEKHRLRDKIRDLISNSEQEKLKAIAIALFGVSAVDWSNDKSEIELRKYSDKKPLELEAEFSSKTYESKYLSALAFTKGLVENNLGQTAVVWNDTTKDVIVYVGKGENGINKLGEFLSEKSEESLIVLQTINERIKKLEMNLPKKEKDVAKTIKDKDAEIEALKKQLAEAQKGGVQSSTNGADDSELAELQAKYKEKEGKEVPPRFKNDKEWIAKKLAETTTE